MELLAKCLAGNNQAIIKQFQLIRQLDKLSNEEMKKLKEEEDELLNELKHLSNANKHDFNEEAYLERYKNIMLRRQHCQQQIEHQMHIAQHIYDDLDNKIKYFDETTINVSHLMPTTEELQDVLNSKKKKRRKKNQQDADQPLESMDQEAVISQVPSSEPLYCYCRGVSYGQMIACENEDCKIEWFHFECVGLTKEPEESWYCPTCRENKSKE